MHDTLLRRVDTDFVPRSATMHMIAAGGGYERTYLPGELVGEGGVVSTVDDMLRWLKHMADPIVGTPETWALMSASHRLHGGHKTGYGLGLFRCAYREFDAISHGGGGLGSNSQMIRVPGVDLDVIAMANRHDVHAAGLVGKVLDSCLGIESPAFETRARHVTGLFRSRTTGRVIQLYAREGEQMALLDGVESPMVMMKDSVLKFEPSSIWNLAVKWRGDPASPDSITYEFFGRSDELEPVSLEMPRSVGSVVGDYVADTIGVRLNITESGENGCARTVGRYGSRAFHVEAIGAGLWKFKTIDTTG